MKKLATISFDNISNEVRESYRVRRAARAIVFDRAGKIAILAVTKHNYHKLPGGGIDEGETELEALRRECLEEIGCNIEVEGESFGEVEEFRDKVEVHQVSVCYQAKVVGEKGKPNFTEKEISKGFKVIWVEPSEAIVLLEKDESNDYEGPYIQQRDLLLLREIF